VMVGTSDATIMAVPLSINLLRCLASSNTAAPSPANSVRY
jgi:hypothetical protein